MKRVIRLICLVVFFVAYLFTGYARNMHFRHYKIDDGLSSNRINCITQDSIGFMWFGTNNGLNRFDGYNFKVYTSKDGDETALRSRMVTAIIESTDRKLWIGTDAGVDIFDPVTGVFTRFDKKTITGESLEYHIVKILEDDDGEFWFATRNSGLFRYSPHKEVLTVYRNEPDNAYSLAYDNLWDLFEDSRGLIWLGCSQQGMCAFSKATGQFRRYQNTGEPGCLQENAVHKIFEDSFGRLWIGTFNEGIALFDRETETFTAFLNNRSDNQLRHLHDINEYSPGVLFISSDEGVTLFNTSNKETISYKSRVDDPYCLSDNSVYTLYCDYEGSFWMGTYNGGVNFCSPYLENFTHYQSSTGANSLKGNIISCFTESNEGLVWVGTEERGVFEFDPQKKIFKQILAGGHTPDTYYNIQSIGYDEPNLWIGTYTEGLKKLNMQTGESQVYYYYSATDSTSICSNTVSAIMKSGTGEFYFGTDMGVSVYNPVNDKFRQLDIGKVSVNKIVQDSYGMIWLSTSRDGVFSIEPKNGTITNYKNREGDDTSLVDNNVITMCVDNRGRLWFGTMGEGFCRFDYEQKNFVRYKETDLPDKVVNCIFSVQDDLWIVTNNHVVKFNPETGDLLTFSHSKGILCDQYTEDTGLKTANGMLYMGGVGGMDILDPQNIRVSSYVPAVVVTRMTLFDKDVTVFENHSPITKSIEYEKQIILTYDQSMIGFELAALSFLSPDENKIEYTLQGFDKQWYTVTGKRRQVSYTGLPAGDYLLRVRGDGREDREITLSITITPPFYLSSMALFVYFLLAFFLLALLIVYLVRRSEKKHKRKINLLNTEKEKEIYEAKLEFFTNIAHEIRTPLSLITGPLEFITKAADIPDKYGNYLNIIERNCIRLLTLVNQLLDFRKVETKAFDIRYSKIDLKEFLETMLKRFSFSAEQNNIRIELKLKDIGSEFVTDEEILTKVFSNLLTNGIKYAESRIEVSVERKEKELCILLSDDGAGIPDTEKKKIFDLFYQSPRSETENKKMGIGIGLHLTKVLVELLEGELQVYDNPERKGVTFSLRLPVKTLEIKSIDPQEYLMLSSSSVVDESEEMTTPAEARQKNEKTALIVDDNPDIRHFLLEFLQDKYFLILAADADEALKLLDNNIVHIIVSDVMMPGMDGFEFCERVKEDIKTSHIPVILLTAKTDMNSRLEGLETGADAYIEKPFSTEHLMIQMKNLLLQREKLQERYATNPLIAAKTVIHSKADEKFIGQTTKVILEHITNAEFQVDDLAECLYMGRSSFFTKIKAITGMSPNDFIRLVRLKEASRLILEGEYRVNEICFLVGFNSPSYFAKCFNKQFDMLPSDFIRKCRESAE